MPRSRVGVLMVFLACALLAGCVRYRGIAESAVDFNRAVERAQNEMLLLNAVRAAKRRPMYITGVSSVTGSVRAEVSAGLDIPLSNPVDKVSPRATYSESPTFSVPVLDTQEFVKGFLQPVPNGILSYYWELGWPRSLLMHLFLQRVRVRVESPATVDGKSGTEVTTYTFDNYPDSRDETLCKYVKFSRFVDRYLAPERNPRFEVRTSTRTIGPPLRSDQIGSLEQVLIANRDGLEVVQEDDHFRIRQQRSELTLAVDGLDEIARFALSLSEKPCDAGGRPEKDAQVSYQEDPGEDQAVEPADRMEMQKGNLTSQLESVSPGDSSGAGPKVAVDFFIRSPEAMLYYLGQLIRVEEAGRMPEICIQGQLQPIFNAVRNNIDCGQGSLWVRYEEEDYVIPKDFREHESCAPGDDAKRRFSETSCVAGRSMQTLSLLNQLIALQKSAKDLPGTGVIRTIGQ